MTRAVSGAVLHRKKKVKRVGPSAKVTSDSSSGSPPTSTGSQTDTEGFFSRFRNKVSRPLIKSPKKVKSTPDTTLQGAAALPHTPSHHSVASSYTDTSVRPLAQRPTKQPQSIKRDARQVQQTASRSSQKRPSLGGNESAAKRSRTSLHRPDDPADYGMSIRSEALDDPFSDQAATQPASAVPKPGYGLPAGLRRSEEVQNLASIPLPRPKPQSGQSKTQRDTKQSRLSWRPRTVTVSLPAILSGTDKESDGSLGENKKEKKSKKSKSKKKDGKD